MGREAEPAGRLATCSRAVRASCPPALRPACEVRRWKWGGRPAHEAWPGSHQGTTTPLGRAVVERRQASAPDSGRAAQAASSVARTARRLRAGLTTVRLPAFRFLYFFSSLRGAKATKQSRMSPLHWIASRSLSPGRALRADPLARNDGGRNALLFDIARARRIAARDRRLLPAHSRASGNPAWVPACAGTSGRQCVAV